MTSTDKSKKRRHNNINKVKLWNIFDNEVNSDKKPLSLECIYRKSGNREICERCEYKLALSDEGFWCILITIAELYTKIWLTNLPNGDITVRTIISITIQQDVECR